VPLSIVWNLLGLGGHTPEALIWNPAMFKIPLAASRPTISDTHASAPTLDADQLLASTHSDMIDQMKNPSPLRKQHDAQAIDHERRFELGRLKDYLLSPATLRAADQGGVSGGAIATVSDTLVRSYERSPTFRRLFNHSFKANHLSQAGRFDIREQPPVAPARTGHIVLIDSHQPDRGPFASQRVYQGTAGKVSASRKRMLLEQLLAAVTGLPDTEKGHLRGPIQEYTNIVLKESGERAEPAYIAPIDAKQAKPATRGDTSPRAILRRALVNDSRADPGAASSKNALYRNVKAELTAISEHRLASITSRARPTRPDLQRKMAEDVQSASGLSSTLLRLLRGVDGKEAPMDLLTKLAQQNKEQRLFTYRIDKSRDPFDMVRHRDGDCASFSRLFEMIGQAAGVKGLETVSLEGRMSFVMSQDPEIANWNAGDRADFARHSILSLSEDGSDTKLYFDPVFGRQVDPRHYGKDASGYLRTA
jgi:hypothetical protein